MEENEIIVGLDIGTTKVVCFVGQRAENDKVRILGYGRTESSGVQWGDVVNIISVSDAIKQAVREASQQADVNIEEVYVGIAGQHIQCICNQGLCTIPPEHEFIQEDDLERLINSQYNIMIKADERIVHVFPQQYIVDKTPLDVDVPPVGVKGRELQADFHIVKANVRNLSNIHSAIERAGLKVKGVVLQPVASSLAVLDESDRNVGVALVDIGGGTTDIAVFVDNIIRHTSVLPLAGNAITQDIKSSCTVMSHHAEMLKIKFGHCLPETVSESDFVSIPGYRNQPPHEIGMKQLAQVIKARVTQILEQVDYEINLSGVSSQLMGGVVLTGGGAQLNDIKELTEFITGKDVRIGLPDAHLAPDTSADIINSQYSTGIGLVIYGIQESERERRAARQQEEQEPESGMPDPPSTPDPEPDTTEGTDGGGKKPSPDGNKKKPGLFEGISKFLKDFFRDGLANE